MGQREDQVENADKKLHLGRNSLLCMLRGVPWGSLGIRGDPRLSIVPIFPFPVLLVAISRPSHQYDEVRNHRKVRYFGMEEERGWVREERNWGNGEIGYEGAVGAKTTERATRT